MATSATISHASPKSKISKWLANKSLKLSFNLPRSKSKSRSLSLSSSSLSSISNSSTSPNDSPTLMPSTADSSTHDHQHPRNDNKLEDELRQVFRRFDANDDGKISALELRSYFGSIGEYMSHEQAKAVIDDFDADGDELLDFSEFLSLVGPKAEGEGEGDHDDHRDLKSAFEMFELEKGCITPRSVQRMLNRLGDTRSYDECKAMVRVFDKDGNGVLDFNEFHQMMMT